MLRIPDSRPAGHFPPVPGAPAGRAETTEERTAS